MAVKVFEESGYVVRMCDPDGRANNDDDQKNCSEFPCHNCSLILRMYKIAIDL